MSQYANYNMRNNLSSQLYTPISSSATTIQVQSGQGERRGTNFPTIATLEKYDSDGKVIQREIVLITARSGDVLTVQRKAFDCFPTDDDNIMMKKSRSFDEGDMLSNYIAKEYLDKINDAINDIYDNGDERVKAIPTGGLNIEITDGNVRVGSEEFYYEGGTATLNNNSTNYVMLDGAGTIHIDTEVWNQKYVKIATIITSSGAITNIKQWKMDAIGGEIGGGGGFKNISNCMYKGGLLVYFIADGEEYNLTYKSGRLKTIVSGEKTYTMTYSRGKLIGAVES